MKSTNFNIVRYDADEGKVFDWKEPRFRVEYDKDGRVKLDKEGKEIKIPQHLYAKTLFIGGNDNIENYIEVEMPKED